MLARFGIIAPLFLLSGGTALLYQVAFGKQLATIFGATAYAVSAVLAAFMGGLALGSHIGGRYARRVSRPLRAYGIAEIIVGAVCALTPHLFEAIAAAYLAMVKALPASLAVVSGVRAFITALVVLVPTIAMGVTLPMLARAVASDGRSDAQEDSRRNLALLYALNTSGGALGALLSAYLVLPALGVYQTMRAAALVNLAIGVIAIVVGRSRVLPDVDDEDDSAAEAQTDGASAPAAAGNVALGVPLTKQAEGRLLLGLALVSGFLVFAAEVVDTHLLALLIGNSAYAFGLMLAVFLTCLSIGAAAASWLDRRLGTAAVPVALSLTAIVLLATLPIWGQLPRAFLYAGQRVSSWAGRELVRAAVAFGALAPPTICMGLTFPLLLRRVAGRSDVGQHVGALTAINTVGSIAGCLGCGYLLLPAGGSENTMRILAVCFAASALVAAAWQSKREARRLSARMLAGAGLVVTVLVAAIMPRWDMTLMTNGANVYFDSQPRPDVLEFVAEDVHGGLTSVARRGKVLTMYTNGKFQGDNSHEIVAQRSFAHFPSLFVPKFGRALVIGLGTGTTLGTIAAYPYEKIDVAEISPSIVLAARVFFSGPNRGALEDKRVSLSLNDGRNVLLLTRQRYDLITIELTSVWFAGAASLYSEQFYELCKSRMSRGAVLQQWVQLHHIHRREVAVVLRTVQRVFPHVALFVSGGQGIIVAASRPLLASRSHLAELSAQPQIRQTLGKGMVLEQLVDRLLISGDELRRFVSDSAGDGGPVISTDENLYLEYATPKGNVMNYSRSLHEMLALLRRYRVADPRGRHLVD